MKKFKRILLSGGLLIATVLVNPISCCLPIAEVPVEIQAAEAPTVEPRADEIYWVYRTLADGTIQKRRWNSSRNRWEDPYWITVG